jgi:SAM-dependent methyltransferase
MERRGNFYSLLALPSVYRLFSRVVLGDGYRIHMAEYVKPVTDEKVFDIGCGPGDILDYLPPVRYVGFDINPKYIEAAQLRFGGRGRFFCGDVGLSSLDEEAGTFDLALATGVVHHVDDAYADRLFELAYRALKPGGRLITYDGCLVAGQPRLARWVVSRDRGQFVRTQEHYERLASRYFPRIEAFVRHDLLRIPYTHLILRCIKPKA